MNNRIISRLRDWNRKRIARNTLTQHAIMVSGQHKQPARKWIRFHRYYLHTVKSMRIKAEDIATRQREKGFDTAIVELNKTRSAYAVYLKTTGKLP